MTSPARFRKRPFTVTAMQWLPGDLASAGMMVGWLMANGVEFNHPSGEGETTTLRITGPGRHTAQSGDWIVRRDDGHTFALPADEFAAAYEPVHQEGGSKGD